MVTNILLPLKNAFLVTLSFWVVFGFGRSILTSFSIGEALVPILMGSLLFFVGFIFPLVELIYGIISVVKGDAELRLISSEILHPYLQNVVVLAIIVILGYLLTKSYFKGTLNSYGGIALLVLWSALGVVLLMVRGGLNA